MFILFKKRNLSGFINDTLSFFKLNGKHYFKNYFIINGVFLLVLVTLIYFIFKIYFEILFSNIGSTNLDNIFMENYFNNNLFLFIGTFIFFLILTILLTLVNFSYPIVYLQLLEENKGKTFQAKEIFKGVITKQRKIITFSIGFVFIIFPLMIVLFMLILFLVFLIIGIPLLIIFIPAFMSWISLSFYEHINNNNGFFSSLKKGYNMIRQQFWSITGSTFIMYLVIQTILIIITMIPYFIGIFSMFVTPEATKTNYYENITFMSIIMVITMIVSILLNYILNNLILVNQGIIYYSIRENNENNTPQNEIDLIGTYSE